MCLYVFVAATTRCPRWTRSWHNAYALLVPNISSVHRRAFSGDAAGLSEQVWPLVIYALALDDMPLSSTLTRGPSMFRKGNTTASDSSLLFQHVYMAMATNWCFASLFGKEKVANRNYPGNHTNCYASGLFPVPQPHGWSSCPRGSQTHRDWLALIPLPGFFGAVRCRRSVNAGARRA